MGRCFLITLMMLGCVADCRAADRLVVHEWGTFTSLQDEQGISLGRINTDDEPVPAFVHQMANASLFPPTLAYTSDAKGTPEGDPDVTMRLETPVLDYCGIVASIDWRFEIVSKEFDVARELRFTVDLTFSPRLCRIRK